MSGDSRRAPLRGLGIVLVAGFTALLTFALVMRLAPAVVLLSSAGILTGAVMILPSRWTNLIEACGAAIVSVVFLAAGVVGLIRGDGAVASSLGLVALGAACGVGAVLWLRRARRSSGRSSADAAPPPVD